MAAVGDVIELCDIKNEGGNDNEICFVEEVIDLETDSAEWRKHRRRIRRFEQDLVTCVGEQPGVVEINSDGDDIKEEGIYIKENVGQAGHVESRSTPTNSSPAAELEVIDLDTIQKGLTVDGSSTGVDDDSHCDRELRDGSDDSVTCVPYPVLEHNVEEICWSRSPQILVEESEGSESSLSVSLSDPNEDKACYLEEISLPQVTSENEAEWEALDDDDDSTTSEPSPLFEPLLSPPPSPIGQDSSLEIPGNGVTSNEISSDTEYTADDPNSSSSSGLFLDLIDVGENGLSGSDVATSEVSCESSTRRRSKRLSKCIRIDYASMINKKTIKSRDATLCQAPTLCSVVDTNNQIPENEENAEIPILSPPHEPVYMQVEEREGCSTKSPCEQEHTRKRNRNYSYTNLEEIREKMVYYWCKVCDTFFESINILKKHINLEHGMDSSRVTSLNTATWDLEIAKTLDDPQAIEMNETGMEDI